MEVWKDVDGYEGLYQVSNLGSVKRIQRCVRQGRGYGLHTLKEIILSPYVNRYGYLMVGLTKNGKQKAYSVHQLVAKAFIPNPNGLPYVNHKNENKKDCYVKNLEWCDSKYNANYGTRNKRVSEATRNHPAKSKKVYQYEKDGTLVKQWLSTREVARQTGYSQGNIQGCCVGRLKTAYGYVWKYGS